MSTYKSYAFKDKDPIIDTVRTVIEDSGASYRWIELHSGVTANTLNNWFHGSTKRPQTATVIAVLRSLGFTLHAVPFGLKPEVTSLIEPAAPREATRHAMQMAKYK
jgi:hypothetical protein